MAVLLLSDIIVDFKTFSNSENIIIPQSICDSLLGDGKFNIRDVDTFVDYLVSKLNSHSNKTIIISDIYTNIPLLIEKIHKSLNTTLIPLSAHFSFLLQNNLLEIDSLSEIGRQLVCTINFDGSETEIKKSDLITNLYDKTQKDLNNNQEFKRLFDINLILELNNTISQQGIPEEYLGSLKLHGLGINTLDQVFKKNSSSLNDLFTYSTIYFTSISNSPNHYFISQLSFIKSFDPQNILKQFRDENILLTNSNSHIEFEISVLPERIIFRDTKEVKIWIQNDINNVIQVRKIQNGERIKKQIPITFTTENIINKQKTYPILINFTHDRFNGLSFKVKNIVTSEEYLRKIKFYNNGGYK